MAALTCGSRDCLFQSLSRSPPPKRSSAQCDFMFDHLHRLGRKPDELHTDPHARLAVAHFATGSNVRTSQHQSKSQILDCSLGKDLTRVDEHSSRAEIWRLHHNLRVLSFVRDRDFAEAIDPGAAPCNRRFSRQSTVVRHLLTASRLRATLFTRGGGCELSRLIPQNGQKAKFGDSSRAQDLQAFADAWTKATTRCTSSIVVSPSRTKSNA